MSDIPRNDLDGAHMRGTMTSNVDEGRFASINTEPSPADKVRDSVARAIAEHGGIHPRHQEQVEDDSRRTRHKDPQTGRFVKSGPVEADEDASTPPGQTEDQTEEVEDQVEAQPVEETLQAPTAWTKTAKAQWDILPDAIKKEVLKREQDTQKGVDQLKKQYTEYDNVKSSIEPFAKRLNLPVNHWIGQLHSRALALTGPEKLRAYENLGRELGIDPRSLPSVQAMFAMQGQGQAQGHGQAYDPQLVQYIQGIAQKLDHFERQDADRRLKDGQEHVDNWSKDKPYFEHVRQEMYRLLSPDPRTGQAEVPLKDGKIDLDTAYAKALEPWQAMIAQQRQQDAAQRTSAMKAAKEKKQRAATTIPASGPGKQGYINGAANRRGLSVRDSLRNAIEELRE